MQKIRDESLDDRLGTIGSALDGVAAAMLAGSQAGNTHSFLRHELEGFYTILKMIKTDLSGIAGELRSLSK